MVYTTFNVADIEYFLLVFARLASFVFVAPFFGMQGVPALAKIGVCGCLSIMVVNTLAPDTAVYYSAIGFGILVVKEVVCGLILGFSANMCQYIITHAGNLIDMDIGLTMASEFDPTLNTQVTITGNIYYYFMLLLMLLSGVHQWLIKAICDSFILMPLGGQVYQPDYLLSGILSFMTNLFILAFRIFLPIFGTMLIVNVVLGIMAKVAPQMNMFSVGMQIKVVTGLVIIFFMVFLFPNVVEMIIRQMRIIVTDMTRGMYVPG